MFLRTQNVTDRLVLVSVYTHTPQSIHIHLLSFGVKQMCILSLLQSQNFSTSKLFKSSTSCLLCKPVELLNQSRHELPVRNKHVLVTNSIRQCILPRVIKQLWKHSVYVCWTLCHFHKTCSTRTHVSAWRDCNMHDAEGSILDRSGP
jgi:hypothetical protein